MLCMQSLSHSQKSFDHASCNDRPIGYPLSICKFHAKFSFLNTSKSFSENSILCGKQYCAKMSSGCGNCDCADKANAPRRATPSGSSSSLKPSTSSTRIWKVQRTTANADEAASAMVAPATTDGAHNIIEYNNSTPVLRRPSI